MNLEHQRKEAKALVRAFRTGRPEAVARAVAALGPRAHERFALSDAQHVVAAEHGYRSWPELRHAAESARHERLIDSGLEYRRGEPVRVRVVQRGRRFLFTDDGAAVERAGRTTGWRAAAQRVVDAESLNLSRGGAVFVPSVAGGPSADSLVARVAAASLAVYQEILDLD